MSQSRGMVYRHGNVGSLYFSVTHVQTRHWCWKMEEKNMLENPPEGTATLYQGLVIENPWQHMLGADGDWGLTPTDCKKTVFPSILEWHSLSCWSMRFRMSKYVLRICVYTLKWIEIHNISVLIRTICNTLEFRTTPGCRRMLGADVCSEMKGGFKL